MIKGVLFDKDDTLIDIEKFWVEPCRETSKEIMGIWSIPMTEDSLEKMMYAAGFYKDDRIVPGGAVQCQPNDVVVASMMKAAEGLGANFADGDEKRILDIFHKNIFAYGRAVELCDLKSLFSELHGREIVVGIATSDEYEITEHCMALLGVTELVDILITADRVAHHKPAPDSAWMFFEKYGLSADEVIMVGDSEADMGFARNAGILGVKYAHDGDTRESLADYIVESPMDVLKIIVDH